eukprot:g3613.t1
MSNPGSLLNAVRKADDKKSKRKDTTPSVTPSELLNQKQVPVEKRKGLIQECDADGEVHEPQRAKGDELAAKKKNKKKKKKVKKKAVKKGFLNSAKGRESGLGLYPEGGSNEDGFTTGRPKKGSFMDKCKVVDTRSMDPETYMNTMAEYAATGTTSAPASISTSGGRADAARRAGKKPPQDAVRQAKPAEKKQVKRPNPVEEADFDRLMELIDPDSAKSNVNDDNSGLDNALGLGKEDMGMLQSMLFGQGMEGLGGASKSKSTRPSPAAPASKTMPGLKGQLNLPTLKYDIATDGVQDKKGNPAIRCTIFCPGCSNFAELALDMSDRTIKLRAPGAQPLTVRLPCKVDAARVAAKFKKKLQKLVLTMPLI